MAANNAWVKFKERESDEHNCKENITLKFAASVLGLFMYFRLMLVDSLKLEFLNFFNSRPKEKFGVFIRFKLTKIHQK